MAGYQSQHRLTHLPKCFSNALSLITANARSKWTQKKNHVQHLCEVYYRGFQSMKMISSSSRYRVGRGSHRPLLMHTQVVYQMLQSTHSALFVDKTRRHWLTMQAHRAAKAALLVSCLTDSM